jgi:DegV family protein with EDD domain
MSKVAIVTDSTAYIPEKYLQEYLIKVAPAVLIWGEEELLDGIDIQPTQFYQRLEGAEVLPSTSQVSIPDFKDIFSQLHESGYDILAILVSTELSGTTSSAEQARKMLPEARIEIVNSRTTAMALGFHVLAAARAAAEGGTLEGCKAVALKAQEHSGVVFAVDTLEFLHRGGRIGGGKRFMGTVLNIKPILEVHGGKVDAVEQVRTRKKALSRLIEIVEERTNGETPIRLAVIHANASEEAKHLLARSEERLSAVEAILADVSPVVGALAGPGTIGLAYLAGM